MKSRIAAATGLFSVLLFTASAHAASQLQADQTAGYRPLGEVSAQIADGSEDDAVPALSQKADRMGGHHFVVTDVDRPGRGNQVVGHAEVYN